MAGEHKQILAALDAQTDLKAYRSHDRWQAMRNHYYDAVGYATRFAMVDRTGEIEVLDAGCGTGSVTEAIMRLNEKAIVRAIDLSEGALARARERLLLFKDRVDLIRADLIEDDLGGPYDIIFCFEVLHYDWFDLDSMYVRFFEALKPGGMLVVGAPMPAEQKLSQRGEQLKDDEINFPEEILTFVSEKLPEISAVTLRHVRKSSRTDHFIAAKNAGFILSDLVYLKYNLAILAAIKG